MLIVFSEDESTLIAEGTVVLYQKISREIRIFPIGEENLFNTPYNKLK
jgi:hypothetical protein